MQTILTQMLEQYQTKTLTEKKNAIIKAVEKAQKDFNECDQELNQLQSAVNTLKNIIGTNDSADIQGLKDSRNAIVETIKGLREEKESVRRR